MNVSGGGSYSSITNTITFQEPNGTYNYSIGNITGYIVLPQSGVVAVDGKPLPESITFTQTVQKGYFVGSVSPSNVNIYVNCTSYTEQNGSFNISLSPGNYGVKISAQGYKTYTTNITVSSSTVTALEIHSLTKVSKHSSFPLLDVVVITAAIAIIAAISAAILLRKRKR